MSRLQSVAGRVPQGWSFGHWPLRRKLAAAVALPVMLAFVFGGLRVQSDVTSAQQLSRAADTVLVIRPVVDYNIAVQRLAAAGSVGGSGVISAITRYESAAADLRIALKTPGIPETAKRNGQSALALGQAVRNAKTQSGFSDVVIDRSGNIATLLSTAVSDLGLSDDSSSAKIVVSLQDAIAAQRAMTGQQLNLANTNDGAASLRAIGQVGAETAALTRLQSQTVGDPTQIRQLLNENGRRGGTLQQEAVDKTQVAALGPVIESSNAGYAALLDSQLVALESNLRERGAVFRDTAVLNAALVAVALLAALIIVLALLRSLLVPIRAVRQGALDVAQKRLPEAVAAMRDGTAPPAFVAIPVHTREEMGQLARAVDDLHSQALSLAGDQARLRVQVGHMFETLSRRSTSLIDQQLSLIERLESDEEDPKRLQSLFRLDHLAARMRRNSDSLLVLAGTSTRRGFSGAVSVSDAVRAAVSEVENYERIDIGDTSNDQVLGAVGSDLIHLVAEVVDNALAYSPPTTRVDIRGARTPEGGLLVEVSDRGLGMPPKELAALNDRLAHGGDITPDTARRMGLFVVGSLAKRHGIAVRLRRNGDSKPGITVSVHLPAGLLADNAARTERPVRPAVSAAPAAAAPTAPTAPVVSAVGGTTKAGLPTRVRGASGAPSPVVDATKKVLPTRTPGAHGPTTADAIPAIPIKPVIEGAVAADSRAATNGHHTNGVKPAPNGAKAADEAKVAEAKAAELKAVEDAKA
ncbi:MAG: ATP-binding protein, partial [Pedococcus sp.]